MRRFLIGIALFAAACNKVQPAPVAPRAAPAADVAAVAPAADGAVRGKIAERIDTPQYSYLRLQTASGEVWAAVTKTEKAVGADVAVTGIAWMENFQSKTLNRTWPRIAFGSLDEGAPVRTAQELPAGHPAIAEAAPAGAPAGVDPAVAKFATSAGAGQGSALHQHPAATAAADLGAIKVAKAAGGRTVSDIWKDRAALKDKKVAVRGKVVKATMGVLGKNWLHVRDGSGEGPTSDLTVATADSASVGDTVLISGVVHLDRDLGAGYHYDVIVEDAQVKAE